MGTHSSAISALASSVTHDLYASWTGRDRPGAPAPGRARLSAALGRRLIARRRWSFTCVAGGGRHAGRGARALDRVDHLRRRCSAPISWPDGGPGPAAVTWSAAIGVDRGDHADRVLRRATRRPGRRSAGSRRWAAWPGRGTCRSAPLLTLGSVVLLLEPFPRPTPRPAA